MGARLGWLGNQPQQEVTMGLFNRQKSVVRNCRFVAEGTHIAIHPIDGDLELENCSFTSLGHGEGTSMTASPCSKFDWEWQLRYGKYDSSGNYIEN